MSLQSKSRKRANVCFNDEEIIINPEDVDPNVGRFRNLIQSTVVPLKRVRLEGSNLGLGGSLGGGAHQMYQQHLQDHLKIFGSNANVNSLSNNSANASIQSSLYHGLPTVMHEHSGSHHHVNNTDSFNLNSPPALGSTMGFLLPNPAPDVTPLDSEQNHSPKPFASKLTGANSTGNCCLIVHFGLIKLSEFKLKSSEHFNNTINPVEGSLEPQKKKYAKEAWPGRKPMLGSLQSPICYVKLWLLTIISVKNNITILFNMICFDPLHGYYFL